MQIVNPIYSKKIGMEGLSLNKSKLGPILGMLSILPVIISIIYFYMERGPNADIYLVITIYSILSIIGLILAALSIWMTKRHFSKLLIGLVGLIANLAVLVIAFLLLLALGIGEA
mgnify:CR=1 FL=1